MIWNTVGCEVELLERELHAAKKSTGESLGRRDVEFVEEMLRTISMVRREIRKAVEDMLTMIEKKDVIKTKEELLRIRAILEENGSKNIDELVTCLQEER